MSKIPFQLKYEQQENCVYIVFVCIYVYKEGTQCNLPINSYIHKQCYKINEWIDTLSLPHKKIEA